eukprot:1990198-Pleurochrysis_carterae.AAC.1
MRVQWRPAGCAGRSGEEGDELRSAEQRVAARPSPPALEALLRFSPMLPRRAQRRCLCGTQKQGWTPL